jgi:hypothetical protein
MAGWVPLLCVHPGFCGPVTWLASRRPAHVLDNARLAAGGLGTAPPTASSVRLYATVRYVVRTILGTGSYSTGSKL